MDDSKMQISFPCIIVERPHQKPGAAWTAYDAGYLTGMLAGNKYGDNWDSQLYATRAAVVDCFGDDPADWPEVLREVKDADFPLRAHFSPFGDWAGPEAEADELAFALEYIGHDFSGLDVLESKTEAEAWLLRKLHNMPLSDVRECMMELDWAEAVNPDYEQEEE